MDIADLLSQQPADIPSDGNNADQTIRDDELMALWNRNLHSCGFHLKPAIGRSKLTDAMLEHDSINNLLLKETPIHIKVIGRHMNGSFRCHIGMGKASRPIRSIELNQHMRLLAVFFRPDKSKNSYVSPTFILFPTWLLHLFRYTQHNNTPGRTDVRFLENEMFAKEDHIYRLNHVINTLFRFNVHAIDTEKLRAALELTNYLFDVAMLDQTQLPRPGQGQQPYLYARLMKLLNSPRPPKCKPVCHNCNTKPASRRKLCVACYRYQLKHGEPRPLRLIIASRHTCRVPPLLAPPPVPTVLYEDSVYPKGWCTRVDQDPVSTKVRKSCANCGIQHTHQWYRNICGSGHWCETCKSYYLRHSRVRPPQLFVKAAKRKVNVRALVNWSSFALSSPPTPDNHSPDLVTSPDVDSSLPSSGQTTPLQTHLHYTTASVSTECSSSSSNDVIVYYHQRDSPHYLISASRQAFP
ncbi:hypothetical protein BJV82DRAFT_620525 [Fennellomyces sp. T-0311]|nr:hypothetical protein BJV82DRAFT_620525 [Fennellomyces sp. T-0311]